MSVQNTVFFALLLFEILLNTIAFGPGGFYNDGWKGFDLLVAVGTTTGYAGNNPTLAQFAKSFRLMRVIRLMKMIGPIRVILETMLQSIPQLANILVLILLVYSMFAVVFVSSYGTVKYGYRYGPTLNFKVKAFLPPFIFPRVTLWQCNRRALPFAINGLDS